MDGASNYNHNPLYKGSGNIPLNKENQTENKYPTKIGKYDAVLGRNVRLKTGKDGQDHVKLDSNLGKAVREVLVATGMKKPEDIRYVKDLSQRLNILNSLDTKNEQDYKIAKILAKEIVKDKGFYNSSKLDAIGSSAAELVKTAEGKLYDKLVTKPMIGAMANEHYRNLKGKPFNTHDVLANLESRGVDLKKGQLDGKKFVEKLVEKKYNELPDFHKDETNLALTSEIKTALKHEISQRYQNTLLLESLAESKKDLNEVKNLGNKILTDDYKNLIAEIEKRDKVIVDKQAKNWEIMKEKNPMLLEISSRLSDMEFDSGSEINNDFLIRRHYFNELSQFGVDLEHAQFDKDKFLTKLAEDKVKENPKLEQNWVKSEMRKRYAEIEELMSHSQGKKIRFEDSTDDAIQVKIFLLFQDDYAKFTKEIDMTK